MRQFPRKYVGVTLCRWTIALLVNGAKKHVLAFFIHRRSPQKSINNLLLTISCTFWARDIIWRIIATPGFWFCLLIIVYWLSTVYCIYCKKWETTNLKNYVPCHNMFMFTASLYALHCTICQAAIYHNVISYRFVKLKFHSG